VSAVEQGQLVESRSSVKLVRNSKGDTQIESKVYASSDDPFDVAMMEKAAIELYDRLCQRYPMGGS
jgi:hypothetical protein